MDALPVVSQVKSAYQAIRGDLDGAEQTQINFSRRCPIISQSRSAVEALMGDKEAARETQMEQLGFLSDAADAVPVVGHIKGGIHYICHDKYGGDRAMKASSRSVGVIGGGVGGFFVGGPAGAAAGGVAGGLAVDGLTTGIESAVNCGFSPNGSFLLATRIVQGKAAPGEEFDLVVGTGMDALVGYQSGCFFGAKCASFIERIRSGHVTVAIVVEDIGALLRQIGAMKVEELVQAFKLAYEWVKTAEAKVFGQLTCLKMDVVGPATKVIIGRQCYRRFSTSERGQQAAAGFTLLVEVIDKNPFKFLNPETWKQFMKLISAD